VAGGDPLATWVGGLLTLAVLSYLYAENPVWRALEHLYIGLAAGYAVGYAWYSFLRPTLVNDVWRGGAWYDLLPFGLGLLVYCRYVPRLRSLARYPLAVWVGYGAGYVVTYVPRILLRQVTGSFLPLNDLDNALVIASLLGAMVYFFFTVPREHPLLRRTAAFGRWAILVALGASFGGAVLFRYTVLFGRIDFLVRSWLGLGG
jgi:hypothetical protein